MERTTRVLSSHARRHQRATPEDFVILVIHNDEEHREHLIQLMKEGQFSVYGDSGMKGAIGSALMFTPHVIIFDWDEESEICEQSLDFLRNQQLAAHIADTHVIILATENTPDPETLKDLEDDPHLDVVRYLEGGNYDNQLKKYILRLFLKKQSDPAAAVVTAATPPAELHHHRTASMKDLFEEHKKFNEIVIKTTHQLANEVLQGNPQQIFSYISQTLEKLQRPFLLKYQGNISSFEFTFRGEQNVDKLQTLLRVTLTKEVQGGTAQAYYSDQDRRCFMGSQHKLFFATESPDVFDELGNFSAITQNFEMFLLQAEHRKHQLELMDEFNNVLDDLYVQVENFEWSESLETLKTLVSRMIAPV